MSRRDFLDELGLGPNADGGDPQSAGAGEFLRRLARDAIRQNPEGASKDMLPRSLHLFATLRVGFQDCDDDDASVALALISSLESFVMFTHRRPQISMNRSLYNAVASYMDSTNDTIEYLKHMSLVRAAALGRVIPQMSDFEPEREAGNSGVADSVKPLRSTFIPPTGNAG